jgi:hypothetical protein
MPHRASALDLLDSQYLAAPRTSDDAEVIATAVEAWAGARRAGTVALPAGAGRRRTALHARVERLIGAPAGGFHHEDHVFARDAALHALRRHPHIDVLLYEELPYLWHQPADAAVDDLVAAGDRRAVALPVEVDRPAKARRIACYTSQLAFLSLDGRRLDDAASLPPTERYWRLAPATGSTPAGGPVRA